jgi:hypothetical protein
MAQRPERPRAANIATLEYADSCVQHVSDTLGVTLDVAPFRMPGSNVWQLTIPGSDGRPAVLLTMWTGLKRVDAITGLTTVVFNEVIAVDLVPEVEVQFRTKSRGLLIVARKGNVIVRV